MRKDWVDPVFSDMVMKMALGAEGVLQDWSSHFICPSVGETQPGASAREELAIVIKTAGDS